VTELRRPVRAAVALILLALTVTTGIAPAGAHAILLASSPADGERLEVSPDVVTLTWSEPVTADPGGIEVFDASGTRIDLGAVQVLADDALAASIRERLPEGTYRLVWRVLSADGRPVAGTVVFAVGSSLDAGISAGAPTATPLADGVAGLAGFLLLAGALLAMGLAFLAWFLHDGGDDRRVILRPLRWSAATTSAAAVAFVAARTVQATGGSITTDAAGAVLAAGGTGIGLALLVAGLGALVGSTVLVDEPLAGTVLAGTGLVIAAISFAPWGHDSGDALGILAPVADIAHATAGAVWLGGAVGLAVLLTTRARRPDGPPVGATVPIVVRFSTAAAVAVAMVTSVGVALSFSQLARPAELATTAYGRVLSVKVIVSVLVVVVAARNRYHLVPDVLDRVEDGPGDLAAWTQLTRSLRLQAAGLAVVVALTAGLMALVPPRASAGVSRVFNATQPLAEGVDLNVVMAPAAVGDNEVHLTYLDDSGRAVGVVGGATITFTAPDAAGTTEPEPGRWAGPGHLIVATEAITASGTWDLVVTTDIDLAETTTSFAVPIGDR
jgi:copper transport protein